jgi:hypothetical protein
LPQARVGFGLLASELADALPATAAELMKGVAMAPATRAADGAAVVASGAFARHATSGGEAGDPLVLRFP